MKNKFGYVTINGKEAYDISVFDHGLMYGDGIYETMRFFNGKAFFLEEHLKRLFASAEGINLKIPYSKEKLKELINKTCLKSKIKDAFMRIIVTRGEGEQGLVTKSKPSVIIMASRREFNPLKKVKVTISEVVKTDKNSIYSGIKSLNYMNNILARINGNKLGFDDAILLNSEGFITEATTSNIFLIKNNKIYTPSLDCGLLNGITRKVILKNNKVIEKKITKKELFDADEIFLSGTADFISCVSQLDHKKFINHEYSKKI